MCALRAKDTVLLLLDGDSEFHLSGLPQFYQLTAQTARRYASGTWMATAKAYEFGKHVYGLCARAGKRLAALGASVDSPSELLATIKSRRIRSRAVVTRLERELNSDIQYLEKSAEKTRKALG